MTAVYQGVSAFGSGTTTVGGMALPTGTASGDLVLAMVITKPDTATIVTPAGWTLVANVAGGGGTTGPSVGPTRQAWFSRVKDAGWTVFPTVTVTGGSSSIMVGVRISLTGSGVYDVTAATGTFGDAAPTTTVASTLGSDPGITNGDLLLGGYSSMDDGVGWAVHTLSSPGATVAAPTELREMSNASGDDIAGNIWRSAATAGTSTGVPSMGVDLTVAGRGTATLVRVREVSPIPEVTASLTGSGALSAAVLAVGVTAASLTGSGAFSAQSAVEVAALLAGSGGFTASVGAPEVAAALTGSGAFTVTVAAQEVSALLTGAGVFTAEVETFGEVVGHLAGSGEFTAETVSVVVAATDTSNRVGGRRRGGYAVAVWDPPVVTAPPTLVFGEARDKAQAFGPVTMNGTQPVYDVDTATRVRHRNRIVVGGKDITYFRDIPTPLPAYQLVSPLLYGPATLRLPQVAAAFEHIGTGALKWLRKDAPVKIQRVDPDTGAVVATDYKGVVIAFDTSGRDLSVEIGGEASGRAAKMWQTAPIFRAVHDIGVYAYNAIRDLGLPFAPRLGPTTGINLARFGDTGMLDYISQLCARAWTRSGNQWTIMPGGDGVYRMARKDTTTIDATAYLDDARVVGDLRRDTAEEHNRIYATGVTPEGQRVRFGSYPGLRQGKAAPYPFHDGRNFGVGTTNGDTDTGDGIVVMVGRLQVCKYMPGTDAPGGFDADAAEAIRQLQDDAGLPVTGTMTPTTWRALYDLDATGFSLRWSKIQPAAQASYTRQWNLSGSGGIMGRNPDYDPRRLKSDRVVDLGAGLTIAQMREFARAEKDASEDNWVGTITFHTGALVAGDHTPGDPITGSDLFRARHLKPGMNLSLPQFQGGIVVHVSAVSVDEDGKVSATVDTRARDSMNVWEVIARNRESRQDLARQWERQHRASGMTKDAIDGWDEVGGRLGSKISLTANTWETFEVVAGQEGQVRQLLTQTNPNAEYVVAIFGRAIGAKRLAHLVGNPFDITAHVSSITVDDEGSGYDSSPDVDITGGGGSGATGHAVVGPGGKVVRVNVTSGGSGYTSAPSVSLDGGGGSGASVSANVSETGSDRWSDPGVRKELDDRLLLYVAGTDEEPLGYFPRRKQGDHPLTGAWKDQAGFPYYTYAQPVIYVAVYADRDTTIPAGRIMWPQLEAGA